MISSLISVFTARDRKDKALTNYKSVVQSIKDACDSGDSGCYVDGELINYEIRQRLDKDGFDHSSNIHGDGKDWIFWG